jgi:hypothetical protein
LKYQQGGVVKILCPKGWVVNNTHMVENLSKTGW